MVLMKINGHRWIKMAALLCDHIFMWLCYEQGEAPGLFEDHIDGFRLSYEGSETSIDICSNKKV